MSLTAKAIDVLPRGFRRYLRHAYTVTTGKLHRNHYEMAERDDFMRKAMKMLAYNGITGDYTEFGCHGGMTMRLAHKYMTRNGVARHLWAFDSFSGFPPPESEEDEVPAEIVVTLARSGEFGGSNLALAVAGPGVLLDEDLDDEEDGEVRFDVDLEPEEDYTAVLTSTSELSDDADASQFMRFRVEVQAVPEPAGALLLLFGAAMMRAARRRRAPS